MKKQKPHWQIWVDTGGTFTDALGVDPDGNLHRAKVLSSSGLRGTITKVQSGRSLVIKKDWVAPDRFVNDFTFELLDEDQEAVHVSNFEAAGSIITLDKSVADDSWVGRSFEVSSPEVAPILAARLLTQIEAGKTLPPADMRLATTRGTNALLERKGASVALFITRGFGDLLKIGTQQRPDLFALNIEKPKPLHQRVVEIDERVNADGEILKAVKPKNLEIQARELVDEGVSSAAVVLMNSYKNPDHEQKMKNLLRDAGFEHISISSDLSRFVKLLPRAETTLVNAYLAAIIDDYLADVKKYISGGRLLVMTSAGGLISSSTFTPKDGLLSGPAAGVVGAAAVGKKAGLSKVISFDMGGTSTDVSRYDGDFEYDFEHKVGDAHLMSPAVAIKTVAAGGGSICSLDDNKLQVGPESAGADPGPACYGAGGPFTLTDVNVLAGRLDESNFHIPIDKQAAQQKLKSITESVREYEDRTIERESILEGFLEIANQRMAEAIEKISLRKGYDPRKYGLVAFGGAGGQHCCSIARRLDIDEVIIPENAGLLSAYGLGHAVMEHFEEEQILQPLDEISSKIPNRLEKLEQRGRRILTKETPSKEIVVRRKLLFMRLKGQESTLEIPWKNGQNLSRAFQKKYGQQYGHWLKNAAIEVESIRVVVSTKPPMASQNDSKSDSRKDWPALREKKILFDGEEITTPVYDRKQASPGAQIEGPALILDPYSTIVVEPDWEAKVSNHRAIRMHRIVQDGEQSNKNLPEAVKLELFTHRFTSIAEKMGEMLQRTARSVNVKERYDFSCALLDPRGRLIVNAPHIPVHLGALGVCVRSLKNQLEMHPGDVIVTNHPAYGGSHLPDVTVVTPVFNPDEHLAGFVANRAHHAEIGGKRPGSMPPDATKLTQEGVVISPMYLMRKGESKLDKIRQHLLQRPYPTRSIDENMADLQAQVAANRQGERTLRKLAKNHGLDTVHYYMEELVNRAERLMRTTIREIPNGSCTSKELLDDGTPLCASWKINDTSIDLSFEGSGGVHPKNLNATPAIVNSVVMYVLRLLVDQPVPLNEGLMQAVTLTLPEGLLNPKFSDDPERCPAVVGGNVEISQRLTDTLLKPFKRIACGQGTMNNILFGNEQFGYYETVGGGSGAGPDFDGTDAVHQHMTNTRATDPEILEKRYPVRLDRYSIRMDSGGEGKRRGGNGIIREMTFLEPVQLSVLTQHRVVAPYGQAGGKSGQKGRQWIIRKSGEKEKLEPSDGRDLQSGDRFILHTPGGGGYGEADD